MKRGDTLQSIDNAVVEKKLLQEIIENIEYNKTIVKYYQMHVEKLKLNLKPHKDLHYLIGLNKFKKDNFIRQLIDKKIKELDIILKLDKLSYSIDDVEDWLNKYINIEHEVEVKTLTNKTENLRQCNKYWLLDKYEIQKIKDFKKTNLCKDKFCANCKKVKQASRMARYIPELEEYQNNLYHLTLTIPNCSGSDIQNRLKTLSKAFKMLINYINGYKLISGIDFQSWGYKGAVRSLEITFNNNKSLDKVYHPHYHVGLVLDAELGEKKIINKYSYDTKSDIMELKRLFSEKEILIQKIWYLLVNGIEVNKKNIESLEEGYSCTMDKFPPEDFAELFKYMTKATDENGSMLTYENFEDLHNGLYRVKQIQGYGCLYRIKDTEDMEEYARIYDEYIQILRQKETPAEVSETPQELSLDSEYKLISRKAYYKYLRG